MSKCRKWVLTLGLMAVTPGITFAGPLPFMKSDKSAESAQQTSAQSNQRIADDIAAALRSARISGYDIAIEQRNGTATLTGKVADGSLKTRASDIVGRVPGVIRVDNQLQVIGPAAGSDADYSERQIQPVEYETTVPSRLPTLAAAPDGPFATEASTQDNQVVAQGIASAMAQAGLSGYDVEVRYMDGTALLSGSVGDPSQRARAEQAASTVPGVKSVQNRLVVRQSPSPNQFAMAAYQQGGGEMPPAMAGGPSNMPMPLTYGHPGAGAAESVYNSPNLPEHAWPSYASYPNYSQVAYPQQYSASAWPYIGPFYPYPQVPLGWRQVQLEWDDGSWNLNFRPRTDKWWWFLNPKNW